MTPVTLIARTEARHKREDIQRRAEAMAKRLRDEEAEHRRLADKAAERAAIYEEAACRQSWLNEISLTAEEDGEAVARELAAHDPKALKQALGLRAEPASNSTLRG